MLKNKQPKPKYPWGTTKVGCCFKSRHDLYAVARQQNAYGVKEWVVYKRGDWFECWRTK